MSLTKLCSAYSLFWTDATRRRAPTATDVATATAAILDAAANADAAAAVADSKPDEAAATAVGPDCGQCKHGLGAGHVQPGAVYACCDRKVRESLRSRNRMWGLLFNLLQGKKECRVRENALHHAQTEKQGQHLRVQTTPRQAVGGRGVCYSLIVEIKSR